MVVDHVSSLCGCLRCAEWQASFNIIQIQVETVAYLEFCELSYKYRSEINASQLFFQGACHRHFSAEPWI